jgi:uncharacterized repeat protein (TIGR01451 family)
MVAPASAATSPTLTLADAYGVSVQPMVAVGGQALVCGACPIPLAVGPLPLAMWDGAQGQSGSNQANLLGEPNPLDIPGLLTVKILEQSAGGNSGAGSASADSDTASVSVGGGALTVDAVHSVASAYDGADSSGAPACESVKGRDGVVHFDSLGSTLLGLTINGTGINLNGGQGFCPPSTPGAALDVALLNPAGLPIGLQARVYEVIPDSDGNGIQVNMIHVTGNVLLSSGNVISVDIIVGHAHAAMVRSSESQPNGGGASGAPLTIHKDVAPTVAAPGDTVTYRFSITNNDTTGSCQVQSISDQLAPTYFRFVSGSNGKSNQPAITGAGDLEKDGFSSSAGTNTVGNSTAQTMTWTNPDQFALPAGQSITETFEATVARDTPAGQYANSLTVYAPLCGASGSSILTTSPGGASDLQSQGAPLQVGSGPAPSPTPTPSATPAPSPTGGVQGAGRTLPNTSSAGTALLFLVLALTVGTLSMPGVAAAAGWRRIN